MNVSKTRRRVELSCVAINTPLVKQQHIARYEIIVCPMLCMDRIYIYLYVCMCVSVTLPVFLQPVELVTTCTQTMFGALEVVRAAYCTL